MKKKTKSSSSPNKASAAKEDLRRRREPPFSLYKESSEPNFPEGLASVINLLKGRKNIAVLSGAGMSVSCGIPDFRTKGSGLYSILDTEVRCCFVFRVVLFSGMWDVLCCVPRRGSRVWRGFSALGTCCPNRFLTIFCTAPVSENQSVWYDRN